MADEFWFTVLGPVRAWRSSVEVMLGTVQQRATLAVLLLNGNAHVSVDALWGADPPRSAGRVIRTYVYRLRKALQAPVIESVGGGYLVRVNNSTLDLAAFTQARTDAEAANRGGDPETAATRLREALALWQGQPLADIQGPYAEAQRANLARLRQAAMESRLAAEVELGAQGEVVAELAGLVAENPLHERILRSDPDLLAARPPAPRSGAVAPAQLPADLGDTQVAAGNTRAAWRSWHSAIGIYEHLDPAAANRLIHKLGSTR